MVMLSSLYTRIQLMAFLWPEVDAWAASPEKKHFKSISTTVPITMTMVYISYMIYPLLWTSQLVQNLTSKSKPTYQYISHSSILFGLESFTASSARFFLGKEESCKLKLCAMCIPPLESWNETKPSSLGEMKFETCKAQVWNLCY